MKLPNFFIIGAPRSGTTALYEYLKSHPDIFVSDPKEPHYFAVDLYDLRAVNNFDDYSKLFQEAGDEHLAVGEASVMYLFSEKAIEGIYDFNNKVKIIVMLRNPVDMAYSIHSFALYKFMEKEKDFQKAWNLHLVREKEQSLRTKRDIPTLLHYGEICKLGRQMERLLTFFPDSQIKFILFDDFVKSTRSIYKEVLSFLGVTPLEKQDFPQINKNPIYKNRLIGRFTNRPPQYLIDIAFLIKRIFSIDQLGILDKIGSVNIERTTRPPLPGKFRIELIKYFKDDINHLSKILNIDLSGWLH